MKRNLLIIVLLIILFPLNVKGASILYSNSFDTLDGLNVNTGEGGSVSIDSGQLKLSGARSTYMGAYASIAESSFADPYTGRLADLPGKISWSFNLSNMDSPGANNGFRIHLVSDQRNPDSSSQFSYKFSGGKKVGDRMQLLRSTHTGSPYGNGGETLIDIPSEDGLGPLPEMGSFRIEFTPSTGLWRLYGTYGNSYVDPRSVTNLLGSAHDDTYINDYMPYFIIDSENDGALYFDNLTVEVIPEPATLSLLALGAFLAGRKRK